MPLPHNSDEFFEKELSVYNRSASAGDVMELPSIYVDSEHTGCDRARCRCSPVPLLPEAAQVIEPTQRTILVPTRVPVEVSERPWEREGWCDSEGRCWWLNPEEPHWVFDDAMTCRHWADLSLPHNALPLPGGDILAAEPKGSASPQIGSRIACSPEFARFRREEAQRFNDLRGNPQA